MPLSIENEITAIRKIPVFGRFFSTALTRIQLAVNTFGQHVGVDPVEQLPAPPPVDAVNIKAASGLVHITLTHNSPINKNIQYHVEADTNPSFPAPHVFDLGSSRGAFLTFPAKTDGNVSQSWYFRAYSQYLGSKTPSKPTNFGGSTPSAVSVGGTVELTPLSSMGSGTASPDGTQGGWGLGKTLARAPLGPKRPAI